jgi:polyhydroxyalkanoate synthase
MTDFSEAGDISVFIDDEQIKALETRMSSKGYLEGKEMAQTFNLLRSNDLIWYFVVNNYLLGKDPFPFDLLYWNTDATRMPAKMHSFYLRNMYHDNLLAKPDALTVAGRKIDLTRVTSPGYMLSTREDHIAPWQSTYRATQYFSGKTRFVLADSGHVAGVVNPPAKKKYCFWTEGDKHPAKVDDWVAGATQIAGSWWPDWAEWNKNFAGEKIAARKPKQALGDAPGEYIKARV